MLGFLGDLAKLVQGKAGVRPRDDLDLAGAFTSTMDELEESLSAPEA